MDWHRKNRKERARETDRERERDKERQTDREGDRETHTQKERQERGKIGDWGKRGGLSIVYEKRYWYQIRPDGIRAAGIALHHYSEYKCTSENHAVPRYTLKYQKKYLYHVQPSSCCSKIRYDTIHEVIQYLYLPMQHRKVR